MFIKKKKYYFIIKSTKEINLKNIKKYEKFAIIYRNQNNIEKKEDLFRFRKICKLKSIDFYVANNLDLAIKLNADGIYLSAHNKSFRPLLVKKKKFKIIGSAHSYKEIFIKIKQKCKVIILSKLFQVNYDKKAPYLGVIKFNNFLNINKNLIPLGGINSENFNILKNVRSQGFALMTEIKKKPAIISRLF